MGQWFNPQSETSALTVAALLLIQFPANAPGKAGKGGLTT